MPGTPDMSYAVTRGPAKITLRDDPGPGIMGPLHVIILCIPCTVVWCTKYLDIAFEYTYHHTIPFDTVINWFYTKISDVNLSAFTYRLFHEDFSSIIGINTVKTDSVTQRLQKLIYLHLSRDCSWKLLFNRFYYKYFRWNIVFWIQTERDSGPARYSPNHCWASGTLLRWQYEQGFPTYWIRYKRPGERTKHQQGQKWRILKEILHIRKATKEENGNPSLVLLRGYFAS